MPAVACLPEYETYTTGDYLPTVFWDYKFQLWVQRSGTGHWWQDKEERIVHQ